MKKTILSLFLLIVVTTMSGQTLLNGDLNHDGVIDLADVTALVNVALHKTDAEVIYNSPINTHAYVDLALPSGTLWATCNIGAVNPEDCGLFFAWGETIGYPSDSYERFEDWASYKHCNGDWCTLTKYCYNGSLGYNDFVDNLTELVLEDDAAYVNWGSGWRMPSKAQFDELINSRYTTMEWTIVKGVYGYKITSNNNGNSIFLRAAGILNSFHGSSGISGYYWSRTLGTSNTDDAFSMSFGSSDYSTYGCNRYQGLSVRPVRLTQ